MKKRIVAAMIITTLIMIVYKFLHNGKGMSFTKVLLFVNSLVINDLSLR
jgi:hypothetical protein